MEKKNHFAAPVETTLHATIIPAEVRAGEPVKAFVKVNSRLVEVRVWRLSPLGVEFIRNAALEGLKVGDSLEIEICIGVERTGHLGVVVTHEASEGPHQILGLRFYQDEKNNWGGSERRESKRWSCSADFLPNGVCPNPGRFNEFIFFKVTDLSSKGLRLQTSLRNKFLIHGMTLRTTITFPMVGNATVAIRVENAAIIEKSGKEFLSLGCSFVNPTENFLKLLAQYVFQFGSVTSLKELSDAGLRVEQISQGIEYKYVRTKEEYEQVLELRKLAYGAAGKLASESDVSDVYDTRSRIIIGLYRGKVVASTRLIFNQLEDQMEHEQFVTFDSRVPSRDQICEITRVCTHPEFRGADLLMGLMKFASLTVVQSGRRYVLGCATDSLLPMYTKMGFKSMNVRFTHESLNNTQHTIFICDVAEVAVGKGVSPIVWNILWADVVSYLSQNQIMTFDPAANVRIGIYSFFKPVAHFLLKLTKARKSSRRQKAVQPADKPLKHDKAA